MRKAAAVGMVGGLVALSAALSPAPAGAADYRYWTYWSGSAAGWSFSSLGPASSVPADGSVEGWRFAISRGVRGQGAEPRIAAAAAFRQFCGSHPAPSGDKRVAVVFDFGLTSEAPEGQSPPQPRGTCVEVPDDATGAAILSRAATIRTDDGLVCGIGGYPAGECAPAVTDEPTPTPKAARSSGPGPDESPAPHRATHAHERSGSGGAEPTDPTAATGSTPRADTPDKAAPEKEPPGKDKPSDREARPTPSPTTPAPVASPEPTFITADAQLPADSPGGPGVWPLLLTAAVVAGAGGFFWWRRRT
ncbi:MAG: SCO2322 family protein [Candidatus Nanopelagicales bacterium]